MADAVRNAVAHLNVPVNEAIKMATLRVAKAIGMQNSLGDIKSGFPARFVKFSNDLQHIESLIL